MLFINNDEKRKIREEKLAASKLAHYKNKKLLKILGFVFLIAGIILALFAFINIGLSFKSASMPNFFMFFLIVPGLILIGIGATLLRFGYLKEVGGYIKNESAPIINELSEDISHAIKNVKEALSSDESNDSDQFIVCPSCQYKNKKEDLFCSKCGKN